MISINPHQMSGDGVPVRWTDADRLYEMLPKAAELAEEGWFQLHDADTNAGVFRLALTPVQAVQLFALLHSSGQTPRGQS